MSDKEVVVSVKNLGKTYRVWRDPSARLKAPLVNGLKSFFRIKGKLNAVEEDAESRIANRNRYFYDFKALKDVSFDLNKGDSVGVIGRNGSGKSTLLQMIAGTLTPTGGNVETNGRIAALLELGAGFNDEFTGRENVYMNGAILGLSKSEIDEKFDSIIEFANIGEFIEQPIKTYSSGMRVRLAFAIQAEVDPDILIVDEALAVGDIRFTMKCIRRMRQLIERGTTLIFVSHDLGSIVNFCKEVIWIHEGEVIRRGDPKEVALEYSNFMHYGEIINSVDEDKDTKQESYEQSGELVSKTGDDPTETASSVSVNGGGEFGLPSSLKWEDISKLPRDGNGDADMLRAAMFLPDQDTVSYSFVGGESISIFLWLSVKNEIKKPIICADVYDLKGNLIFGINSCFSGAIDKPLSAGEEYVFRFSTRLPVLRNGDYVVLFGMSNGDYYEHVHVCGVAEAFSFSVKNDKLSQRHHLVSVPGGISVLSKSK